MTMTEKTCCVCNKNKVLIFWEGDLKQLKVVCHDCSHLTDRALKELKDMV